MRYIIPYSFSQQNEFYKVYNTKRKKKKETKKKKKKKRRERKKNGGQGENHSSTKLFWLYSIGTFAELFTQI